MTTRRHSSQRYPVAESPPPLPDFLYEADTATVPLCRLDRSSLLGYDIIISYHCCCAAVLPSLTFIIEQRFIKSV